MASGHSTTSTILLAVIALPFAYPFAWMVVSMFKTDAELFSPQIFWPGTWDTAPLTRLIGGEWFPTGTVAANSIAIATLQSLLATFLASTAGYAVATARRCLHHAPTWAALAVVLIPVQAMAIPLFLWIHGLGLFDNRWGVILPGAVTGIGVLYFTQAFRQIPSDLYDAARLEGASEWRVLATVLPLVTPMLISFALFHFVLAWHEHLLPLLVLHSPDQQTFPVAIAGLQASSLRHPIAALIAASALSLIPPLTLFAIGFSRFRSSLAEVFAG